MKSFTYSQLKVNWNNSEIGDSVLQGDINDSVMYPMSL